MNLFPPGVVAGPEVIADAALEYVAARLTFNAVSPASGRQAEAARVDARRELDAAWHRLLVACGEKA